MPNMAQANTSPAQANTSPNAEEPPLPDFHEIGEADWEVFAECWPPLDHYPREDEAERPPRWVHPPPIPNLSTEPINPREATLSGRTYIEYKRTQIQSLLDMLGSASSFNNDEIKNCEAWLDIIRRQLEITLPLATEVKERRQLERLIAKVKGGLEKAKWFLKKNF